MFYSALVKAEVIEEALATAKAFADKTRGQSGHSYGSPHVQIARTLLQTLIKKGHEANPSEPALTPLREFLAKFEQAGPEGAAQMMAQLRVKLCKEFLWV